MKILVYGAQGWIGKQMVELLKERGHEIYVGEARLEDYDKLRIELSVSRPDYVFSSTGRTHGTHTDGKVYATIDFLELPGNLDLNLRDNLIGPLNLARLCQSFGSVCGYMGTGCIFEYDEKHTMPRSEDIKNDAPIDCTGLLGFNEASVPNFKGSGYSIVKGWTDEQMHSFPKTVCNWRIRMPISAQNNSRDFITKITNYTKVCSIPNSMTVLPEILPIMVQMIEQKVTGTFNMCNPGLITHNQILEMYKQYVNPDFTYQNFSIEEQAQILKAGRSNNYLDTAKLEKFCTENSLTLTPIFDAVQKTLKNRQQ